MRKFLATIFAGLALVGCGGADAAPCAAPVEIIIQNQVGVGMMRQERAYPGAPLQIAAVGDGAGSWVGACDIAGETQYVVFTAKFEGWFSAGGNGDHFAMLSRGTFDFPVPYYLARGVILHRNWGVLGERYYRNGAAGPSIVQSGVSGSVITGGAAVPTPAHALGLYDNIEYHVSTHTTTTGIGYTVTNSNTGQQAAQYWEENIDKRLTTGGGVAFVPLCLDGTCLTKNWKITLTNVSIGRF